ncbi:MAG: hypothetical protein K0U34_02630 [Alphaproteobacteria bacterium]|nr:hypothetical protein [Alphaproteobacteria bacterium]
MRMSALKDFFATFISVLLLAMVTAASAHAENKTAVRKAPQPQSQSAKAEKADDDTGVDERDYYTRRAKELLDKDKSAANSKPHPLAINYPEHFVVVCTGGCRNRQAHIVDFEPRQSKDAVEIGEMIPTAAGGMGAASDANVVRCIAGCGDGRAIYSANLDFDGTESGAWESNTPAQSTAGESGRWLATE